VFSTVHAAWLLDAGISQAKTKEATTRWYKVCAFHKYLELGMRRLNVPRSIRGRVIDWIWLDIFSFLSDFVHFLWSFVHSVRNPYMCIGAWIQGYRVDVNAIIKYLMQSVVEWKNTRVQLDCWAVSVYQHEGGIDQSWHLHTFELPAHSAYRRHIRNHSWHIPWMCRPWVHGQHIFLAAVSVNAAHLYHQLRIDPPWRMREYHW
jgi:hypothetical protein